MLQSRRFLLLACLAACGARTSLGASQSADGGGIVEAGVVDARLPDSTRPEDSPGDATRPPLMDAPVAVLFAGSGPGTGVEGGTWQWDGTSWTQRLPTTSPPARDSAAMASLAGTFLLFGGGNVDADLNFNDTWTWDGTTWTQEHPSQSPSARGGTAMATLNGSILLFGGASAPGGTPVSLNDTWTWDGATWAQHTTLVTAPPPRGYGCAAVHDGTVVLFGGQSQTGFLGDTWQWDGASWTEMSPAQSPTPRSSAAMATLGTTVVLFGGEDGENVLGDTWVWDGETWTEQHPSRSPGPLHGAMAATLDARVFLFGGNGGFSDDEQASTWVWDGENWTELAVTGPSARQYGTFAGP